MEALASLEFNKPALSGKNDSKSNAICKINFGNCLVIILSEERRNIYETVFGQSGVSGYVFSMEEKELLNNYYPYDN